MVVNLIELGGVIIPLDSQLPTFKMIVKFQQKPTCYRRGGMLY